jgi:hypothetical protein
MENKTTRGVIVESRKEAQSQADKDKEKAIKNMLKKMASSHPEAEPIPEQKKDA